MSRCATSAPTGSRTSIGRSASYQLDIDGLPSRFPPPVRAAPVQSRRNRWLLVGAVVLVAALAAVAAVLAHRRGKRLLPRSGPTSLAVIDPKSNKVEDTIDLGFKSSLIAAGEGSVWVRRPAREHARQDRSRHPQGRKPDWDLGRCRRNSLWAGRRSRSRLGRRSPGHEGGRTRARAGRRRPPPDDSIRAHRHSRRSLLPPAARRRSGGGLGASTLRRRGLAHPSPDGHGAEVDRRARRPSLAAGAARSGWGPVGDDEDRHRDRAAARDGPGGLSGPGEAASVALGGNAALVCTSSSQTLSKLDPQSLAPINRPSRSATARATSPSAREQRGWPTAATAPSRVSISAEAGRQRSSLGQAPGGVRRLRSYLDEPGRSALLSIHPRKRRLPSCAKGGGRGASRMARVRRSCGRGRFARCRRLRPGPPRSGRDASAQLDSRRRLRRSRPSHTTRDRG